MLSRKNPPQCLLFNAPSTSKNKLWSLTSCSDWLLPKLCDQSGGVNRSSGDDTPQCKSTTEYVPHAGPSNVVSPYRSPRGRGSAVGFPLQVCTEGDQNAGRWKPHHRAETGSKPASHKTAAAYYCS